MKAYRYYRQAANAYTGSRLQGDASAQLKQRAQCAGSAASMLGQMYWRGEGVNQDNDTARKWFERGEELEHSGSLYRLGLMHLEGTAGFDRDVQKAFSYFTAAANMNVPEAQVSAAEIALQSGKPDAYLKAFKLYSLAADHSNPPIMAIYRLGEMTTQGLGTAANCFAGTGFLKSVVERADWHDLTLHRAHGFFEAKDYESSLMFYLFAAESGYEVAQANAAYIIDKGLYSLDRSRSTSETLEYYYSTSFNSTGLFPKGSDPYEIAFVLWNRAANQNNVEARVKLGDYHFYGLGLNVKKRKPGQPSNSQTTEQEEAVGQKSNSPDSVLRSLWEMFVSIRFGNGNGVRTPDFEKAALYYQVASDEHNALAQWNMGWMYEYGMGVAKSTVAAIRKHGAYLLSGKGVLAVLRTIIGLFRGDANSLSHYSPDNRPAPRPAKGAIPDLPEDAVPGAVRSRSTDDLWGEVVVMTVLAGLIAVLFLWRQLINVNPPRAPAVPEPPRPPAERRDPLPQETNVGVQDGGNSSAEERADG
ncbi:ERAD-associated protein, partial [Cladochytrium tenue]